ncbi:helix-turn-helix domain-containing protein [Enterovirga sp. CN4-39]|uniref:helix-turn-helix domain-containing protein n=1 Tax=Enterovirga sp. CN4-39 TaxID=3400910 RepID=UPI003BFDA548
MTRAGAESRPRSQSSPPAWRRASPHRAARRHLCRHSLSRLRPGQRRPPELSLCWPAQSSGISAFWIKALAFYFACRFSPKRPGMPRSLSSARQKRLAELLIQYREQAGFNQAEVAKALGRHQPFVSNLESGQRRLDVVELLDLAEAIGFDPVQLLQELIRVPKS